MIESQKLRVGSNAGRAKTTIPPDQSWLSKVYLYHVDMTKYPKTNDALVGITKT